MLSFFGEHAAVSDRALQDEFEFWKDQFLFSALAAVAAAVLAGLWIAAWPQGVGSPDLRDFARALWPPFVEFAFWLGFLIGLLWAAARRIGCALGGGTPWRAGRLSPAARAARVAGQAACGLAFSGILGWFVLQFLLVLAPAMAAALPSLPALVRGCMLGGALLAVAALVLRR